MLIWKRAAWEGFLTTNELYFGLVVRSILDAHFLFSCKTKKDLWQVQNYGMAGFEIGAFKYIFNSTTNAQPLEGNWMASWISFMSDVEYGGSISFWEIGLAVKPIKGSAIMWYNLLPDGNVDPRVGIAHCPVFIGSKWTLPRNFWSTMNLERHLCPAGKSFLSCNIWLMYL